MATDELVMKGAMASAAMLLTMYSQNILLSAPARFTLCVSAAHFMNDFAIVIQIRWKIGFSVTSLYGIILLQNLAHAMTAQLSCHVQNFIVTTLHYILDEIKINFPLNSNFNGKIIREMGPRPEIFHLKINSMLSCCRGSSCQWVISRHDIDLTDISMFSWRCVSTSCIVPMSKFYRVKPV